jgi:ketosteroid isomerase-like protein
MRFAKIGRDFSTVFGPITIQNSDMKVTSHGEMAFATYIAHLTGKGKDGNPMDVTMRITDVLRKSSGKWLIVHEHVSYPAAAEHQGHAHHHA